MFQSPLDLVLSRLDQGAELPMSVRAWAFPPSDPGRHLPRTEDEPFAAAPEVVPLPQVDVRDASAGFRIHDLQIEAGSSRAQHGRRGELGRRFRHHHELTFGDEIGNTTGRPVLHPVLSPGWQP